MVYSREDLQKSLLYLPCRMGRFYALFSGLFKVIFVALFRRRLFLDSAAYLEPYSGVVLSLIQRPIQSLIQASLFLRPGGLFREAFSVVLSSGGGLGLLAFPRDFRWAQAHTFGSMRWFCGALAQSLSKHVRRCQASRAKVMETCFVQAYSGLYQRWCVFGAFVAQFDDFVQGCVIGISITVSFN